MEKKKFPVNPTSDWIIIDRLDILDKHQKAGKKSGLILPEGVRDPKNIMDIEKMHMNEVTTYTEANKKFLEMWDEHPNQAIVVVVGPGRSLGDESILKPSVKVGDHIFYRGKTGEPIVVCKKLYWMIRDSDIYCTVPAAGLIK